MYAPIMHHKINKKNFSAFLKRPGLSKRLLTIVAPKKCKQRLIHSVNGVQTSSKS